MSLDVLSIPDAFTLDLNDGTGRPLWRPYDDGEIQTIIFVTMIVGWGEITEENAKAWYERARSYELASGSTFLVEVPEGDGDITDHPMTLELVRKYIGLRTNVFSKTTDAQFRKQLGKAMADRIDRVLAAER